MTRKVYERLQTSGSVAGEQGGSETVLPVIPVTACMCDVYIIWKFNQLVFMAPSLQTNV